VRNRAVSKTVEIHAASGGARERWAVLSTPLATTRFLSGATRSLEDLRVATAVSDGGGNAAISVRQPTQQQSAQILLLVSSVEGARCPEKSVWQRIPFSCAAASAATLAELKLEIRLASATA
jgi:hypothetical protein